MKRILVLTLIVVLCLGLNGCRMWNSVSSYFASVEDFVMMREKAEAATPATSGEGGNGGDTLDPGPHTLTIFAAARQVTKIHVQSWATDGQGTRTVDTDRPNVKGVAQFTELTGLDNGTYTLKFTTGQPAQGDTPANLKDYTVDFDIKGYDLTLMVLVNNDADAGPTVRVVPINAKLLTAAEVPAS